MGDEERIGGAVLVAGLAEYTGIPELKSFFPGNSYDWKKIRQHCGKFVSINSDNDHYIPLAHGKEFEHELGARLVVLHSRGHFSSSEGTVELPEAREAVLEISDGRD
jgi:predicted alpha/beta hydrolase family esterase